MKLYSTDHVYRCRPPVLGNDVSDDPFYIHLRGISQADFDAAVAADAQDQLTRTPDEALRLQSERTRKMIAERVVKIENLEVDGEPIKDFADLCARAPREIATWVIQAVYRTDILSEAEEKN